MVAHHAVPGIATRSFSLLAFLLFAFTAFAQPRYSTNNSKAIKLYEKGADCMRLGYWECAETDLTKAAQADAGFIEPRIYLAEMYERRGMDDDAIRYYKEVLAVDPSFFPPASLHLAQLELSLGRYNDARAHFELSRKVDPDPKRKSQAAKGLANIEFAQQAIQHPVPFEPVNLGPNVNTVQPEYYPTITVDGSTLLFTRLVKDDRVLGGVQEDFFASRQQPDGGWAAATAITSVNTVDNEGAGTLSADGRFIIFTKCAGPDGTYGPGVKGFGSCDLFMSQREGNRWSKPQNLGPPVNTSGWESQPSLASDGRTLYYIHADRGRGGEENMDIYMARIGDDGRFSKPEKLGSNVNTPDREESVQIHPDGRTLYFSSNGHPGMGGLDIYMSRMQDDGTWGPAKNLGYPINTSADENSLLVDASGEIAYFASDRAGGHGDLDLYSFELYPEARPTPVSYIKGKVTDKETGKPLDAQVELYELRNGTLSASAFSDPVTGEFIVCLPQGVDHALNAAADGYLFYSRNYTFAEMSKGAPYQLDVQLARPATGERIELRNVFFETASYELLPQSTVELEKLVSLLQANPAVRIEVGGHTDSVGKDADNQVLSANRAKAVRDFLIGHGINAARVEAKGYGASRPVASNDTVEGRALNRRTEVTVL